MLASLLVALLLPAAYDAGGSPADRAAYESARAKAGRDAGAHIKLALWCEAHGLSAERLKHLATAVMIDPANGTARGLLGLVAYRGRWQRPDAVGETVKADAEMNAALAEYNARRARMASTVDAHWRLALWCEEHGLKPEASAHLATVVRFDPGREAAWKRLGFKKQGGRWVTKDQLAGEKAEADAQKEADKAWRPRLAAWRSALSNKARRAEAEEGLAGVTDPRAVPSVLAVFATPDPRLQAIAVQLLGQIDSTGSSRALAMLLIGSDSPEVRRSATETLKRRDPREFAGLLVSLLRDPIKYEVRPVGGPGSPGALFVQGRQFNVQRLYAPPAIPYIPVALNAILGYDSYGFAVLTNPGPARAVSSTTRTEHLTAPQFANFHSSDPQVAAAVDRVRDSREYRTKSMTFGPRTNAVLRRNPQAFDSIISFDIQQTTTSSAATDVNVPVGRIVAEYQKAAIVAQEQLASDVATVEAYNKSVGETNERVADVLKDVSGEDRGQRRQDWEEWLTNLKGYAYVTAPDLPVPTIVEDVPVAYQPQPVPVMTSTRYLGERSTAYVSPQSSIRSCFGAGTAVRTLRGSAPIETLRVGDQVLTQDPKSGALGFHPVLVVHHNPPSKTFLVKIGGETIVSSPFHRFWKVGDGWVMAQNLRAGDRLRLLDGPAAVESVESGPVQPVFNLDVAEDHDFFAGTRSALVHDNTLPDLRLAPFDAPPTLAAAPGAGTR